ERVLDVLANDTVDGRPATPAEVIARPLNEAGPLTLDPSGALGVRPGTAAGDYRLPYRICAVAPPDVCASATVVVSVLAPPIRAEDDQAPEAADGRDGSPGFLDVFANDRLGDLRVTGRLVR